MADKSKKQPALKKPASAHQSGNDWQAAALERVRALIRQSVPDAVEDVKWRKPSNGMKGVPVWSHHGIICTGETYKDKVKLTFARGAAIEDPDGLFNASLDAGTRRAIDIHEGDRINAAAFKALVRRASALNRSDKISTATKKSGAKSKPTARPTQPRRARAKNAGIADAASPAYVTLLSGGNPQIPKGDGDTPVQAYIAAMPGWKRQVGRTLDQLVEQAVPGVGKAVRWNSPFYGVKGRGWFLSFHCFDRYLKLTFFSGGSLQPPPPEKSKYPDVRYFHIHEGDGFDEPRLTEWIRQAAALPGEQLFS